MGQVSGESHLNIFCRGTLNVNHRYKFTPRNLHVHRTVCPESRDAWVKSCQEGNGSNMRDVVPEGYRDGSRDHIGHKSVVPGGGGGVVLVQPRRGHLFQEVIHQCCKLRVEGIKLCEEGGKGRLLSNIINGAMAHTHNQSHKWIDSFGPHPP